MRKPIVLFTFLIVPFLASCNNSSIDMPKSPFVDHYERIGMQGEYAKSGSMSLSDYNAIKSYIAEDKVDKDVASYHIQDEARDLKYAYFGQESSTISQCSMTSQNEDLVRYKNRVYTDTNTTEQQIQTANGGIQKTKSIVTDYTFDNDYNKVPYISGNYSKTNVTKINDEEEKISKTGTGTYNPANPDDVYSTFALKPYSSRIDSHFRPNPDIEEYDFKLLGDDNKAVYYMTKDDGQDRYLIKEGYSLFPDFHTTMGRSYKAQDNYFYEGLLEKDEGTFHFTYFRFYHELLILSKALDGDDVPVLYLDKPVLVEFRETKYSDITYKAEEDLIPYNDPIPGADTIEE